uniref:G-protein coupled receptors family 1 profile domain-containing protein n=1 Tax=Petromyzon marinus TaxID=7757 RepID=S4RIW4_PETMA
YCDLFNYSQRINRRTLVFMLLFCWLCSALLSTPILDDCRFFISVGILFAIGMWPYFTSVLLVVLMYGRIYRVARGQARKIAALSRASSGLGGGEEAGRAAAIAIVLTVDESVILPYKVSVWFGYMNSAI